MTWMREVRGTAVLVLCLLGAALAGPSEGRGATLPDGFPPEPQLCTGSSSLDCYFGNPNFTLTPRVVEVGDTITMTVVPQPEYPPGTVYDSMCWLVYPDGFCGAVTLRHVSDDTLFRYDGIGGGGEPHPADLPSLEPASGCGRLDLTCTMRVLPPPGAPPDWAPPRSWIVVGGGAGALCCAPNPFGPPLPVPSGGSAILAVVEPETAIEIVKETVPVSDAQDFAFTGSLGDFTLDTDPGSPLPDRVRFTRLAAGSYTIGETLPGGWQVGDIACDPSSGSRIDLDAPSVTVDLVAGDTVTCTFRNRASSRLVVNSPGDDPDDDPTDGVCDTGRTISRDGLEERECTLRAAVREADEQAGADTIAFSLVDGFVPIETSLVLATPVVLDGTTQPDTGRVWLSGGGTRETGLTVRGGESTIRGLAVSGYTGFAIDVESDGNVLQGNLVGPDVSGTLTVGNGAGIALGDVSEGAETTGNLVGTQEGATGTCGSDCNVIAGNGGGTTSWPDGVGIASYGTNTIAGNVVGGGFDDQAVGIHAARGGKVGGPVGNVVFPEEVGIQAGAGGTFVVGNVVGPSTCEPDGSADAAGIGIVVRASSGGLVAENVLFANCVGLLVRFTGGLEVRDNVVGLTSDGTPAGNEQFGVLVRDAQDVSITRNTIAFTGVRRPLVHSYGIGLGDTDRVTISRNAIYGNEWFGIDLGGDGLTPNDPGDALSGPDPDEGPNGLQNFPVLDRAELVGGALSLAGTLSSNRGERFTIELYASSECDPRVGHGEGERFLVSTEVETGLLDGFTDFTVQVVGEQVAAGEVITATATDGDGNTSEFARCLAVTSGTRPATELTQATAAGAASLDVASTAGFVGKVVLIGEEATAETNLVTGLGSLVLARPLRFAHAAGEPVVALDHELLVSLDRGLIRFHRGGDAAELAGTLLPAQGTTPACGEDVEVRLGLELSRTLPGERFALRKGVCVLRHPEPGLRRLLLDLRRGRFAFELKNVELSGLSSQLEVGLTVGDDGGAESVRFSERPHRWLYRR
jgi:hypothetical protein